MRRPYQSPRRIVEITTIHALCGSLPFVSFLLSPLPFLRRYAPVEYVLPRRSSTISPLKIQTLTPIVPNVVLAVEVA